MRLVADGVFHLRGFPPNAINVYLVEDVLIDSGTRMARRRILRQIEGRGVSAHGLTHAHPDHFGSSHRICQQLGLPLWCGAEDVRIVETGEVTRAAHQPSWMERMPSPEPHSVDRLLKEGDEVAGFRVLDVPGHSPGHIAYWRESDRTLIVGDVLFNLNPLTGVPGLREPPEMLTYDVALNREAIRKVALLEPATVLFGHGPPLRDPKKIADFAGSLPS